MSLIAMSSKKRSQVHDAIGPMRNTHDAAVRFAVPEANEVPFNRASHDVLESVVVSANSSTMYQVPVLSAAESEPI